MAISGSLEDYLEAAYHIIRTNGHAHAKEIADHLAVKMPSVTVSLRQLAKQGLVVYSAHRPVELTPRGVATAQKIVYRHETLDRFLAEILGLPAKQADKIACQIEHLVDEKIVKRIALFSRAITSRADCKKLLVHLTEAFEYLSLDDGDYVPLTALASGLTAQICGFSRNLTGAEKLSEIGITIGETIEAAGFSLDKNFVKALVGKKEITLPTTDAENIWVKVIARLEIEN